MTDYLAHYGTKGMKWGKRKKPVWEDNAEKRKLDQELDDQLALTNLELFMNKAVQDTSRGYYQGTKSQLDFGRTLGKQLDASPAKKRKYIEIGRGIISRSLYSGRAKQAVSKIREITGYQPANMAKEMLRVYSNPDPVMKKRLEDSVKNARRYNPKYYDGKRLRNEYR